MILNRLTIGWMAATVVACAVASPAVAQIGLGVALVLGKLYEAGEFLQVQTYTQVLRWARQIADRPAVKRGLMVNRAWGEPSGQLLERHDASDFDTKTQDKLNPA